MIEKECTVASVADSYDLVAQTVGNWVARYRKSTPLTGTAGKHPSRLR